VRQDVFPLLISYSYFDFSVIIFHRPYRRQVAALGGGAGQFVAAFVFGVADVAAHPDEFDLVLGE
jgi:hypothetical protein